MIYSEPGDCLLDPLEVHVAVKVVSVARVRFELSGTMMRLSQN